MFSADASGGHDLVVHRALGCHLEGLDDPRRDLRVGHPAHPGEWRAVVAGANNDRLALVANRRATTGRVAVACQLLLRAQHISGGGRGVELVDRHQDVGDQHAERPLGDRLLVADELDAPLAQKSSVDEALLDVAAETAQLPEQHPFEARVGFAGATDDLLEARSALEVRAADADVLDDFARGSGGSDRRSELRDLGVDGQLVVRLVGGRDADVDNAVRAGRDLDHSADHASAAGNLAYLWLFRRPLWDNPEWLNPRLLSFRDGYHERQLAALGRQRRSGRVRRSARRMAARPSRLPGVPRSRNVGVVRAT